MAKCNVAAGIRFHALTFGRCAPLPWLVLPVCARTRRAMARCLILLKLQYYWWLSWFMLLSKPTTWSCGENIKRTTVSWADSEVVSKAKNATQPVAGLRDGQQGWGGKKLHEQWPRACMPVGRGVAHLILSFISTSRQQVATRLASTASWEKIELLCCCCCRFPFQARVQHVERAD